MTDEDTFSVDPVEALGVRSRRHLEMAQELDGMERDVTSWEAGFLDTVLKRLREGRVLTEGQAEKLEQIHREYLG
ncbi:MAG: hypothetical protein ACRD1Z_20230 [Vicinamibacteria bacterium]